MLQFSQDKIVEKGNIELSLTENDVETIIVTSLEGGSGYWLGLDNTTDGWADKPKDEPASTWATHLLINGHTLHLFDVEDPEEKWTLTLEKLMEGYKLNFIERPHDNNLDNGDAVTSDCIMQYALFGELVYG